jgi:tRNA threonylcarbamoyladenosine modification (KEOPS) complex Cgi121 subunit
MSTHIKPAKKPSKIRFNVTLTNDANRSLRQLAMDERRSKSNMLEVLIRAARDRQPIKEAA